MDYAPEPDRFGIGFVDEIEEGGVHGDIIDGKNSFKFRFDLNSPLPSGFPSLSPRRVLPRVAREGIKG
jgi:hypothetical protein